MESNILSYIFLFLAGASNGVKDLIDYHFYDSKFGRHNMHDFWHPVVASTNKWKDGKKESGEAFWGSSRWFVVFTEGKKIFKWFMIKFILLAVVAHNELQWWDLLAPLGWYAGFWITYESKLLRK
jgi:hypothetical protein